MRFVAFDYKGNLYTGSLIASDAETPEYYWYFFDNSDLIDELGVCVSFIRKKESLQPTRPYGAQYGELIARIQQAILPYLAR